MNWEKANYRLCKLVLGQDIWHINTLSRFFVKLKNGTCTFFLLRIKHTAITNLYSPLYCSSFTLKQVKASCPWLFVAARDSGLFLFPLFSLNLGKFHWKRHVKKIRDYLILPQKEHLVLHSQIRWQPPPEIHRWLLVWVCPGPLYRRWRCEGCPSRTYPRVLHLGKQQGEKWHHLCGLALPPAHLLSERGCH